MDTFISFVIATLIIILYGGTTIGFLFYGASNMMDGNRKKGIIGFALAAILVATAVGIIGYSDEQYDKAHPLPENCAEVVIGHDTSTTYVMVGKVLVPQTHRTDVHGVICATPEG